MINLRGLRVKDKNPNWPRCNQTGRVVKIFSNEVHWRSDVDGEIVIDSPKDLVFFKRIVTNNNKYLEREMSNDLWQEFDKEGIKKFYKKVDLGKRDFKIRQKVLDEFKR